MDQEAQITSCNVVYLKWDIQEIQFSMENKVKVNWIADTKTVFGSCALLYSGVVIYKILSWISSLSSRKRGILIGLSAVGLICLIPGTNYRL